MSPKLVHPRGRASGSSRSRRSDAYTALVGQGFARDLAKRLGLPQPVPLRRYEPGQSLLDGPVLVSTVGERAHSTQEVQRVLTRADAAIAEPEGSERLGGIVVDLSAARAPSDLDQVRSALSGSLRRLRRCGRVLLIATAPETLADPHAAATHRAIEGIVRSLGKELRDGATANAIYLRSPDAAIGSSVEFFLSARSAYVDAQLVRCGASGSGDDVAAEGADEGRVAVVTGAARGIGAAIVDVLARDGAEVVAVDIPAAGDQLAAVANRVGGTALQVDITAADAGERIAEACGRHGGRLDLLVHNAGITRDKLLVNTDADRWGSVLAVNLEAALRIDDTLLASGGPLASGSRVVAVASLSGIAGNRGQVSYAASKAGVIGMVAARSVELERRGITYNAVAPGFIETDMTARMPLATREVGRRISSLAQGGQPVDVAETIAWLGSTASGGITGQTVRVCGQSLLGA